jgi:hypothetical protein
MAALRLAYAMAQPRVRAENPARYRLKAEDRTDALIDAFTRVLDAVNDVQPSLTTDQLWQRAVGRVIGARGRPGQLLATDTRLRKGYEVRLLNLDEPLRRIILAAHDPKLRSELNKQDRILIQDGTEDWLRTFDWHDVREDGELALGDEALAEERRGTGKAKKLALQEFYGVKGDTSRGWWRRACREHKIKGCSQCIRRARGRPKKEGKTDPAARFNELAHAAGYGPDVFKRAAKAGRPSRYEVERLDLLAQAVLVLHEDGHSLETIGGVIGGGRQRAHDLLQRVKRAT